MAKQETKLDILVGVQGTEKLRGLTSSLKRLKDSSTIAGNSSRKLALRLKQESQSATKTINGTRALASSYRQLANSVKIGSREFQVATRRAERLEAKLRKLNATTRRGKGGLGNLAKIGGTVAAAGVFGGAEGALGSAIGGVFGGVAGAAVGGAVGAQVGQFTGVLKETAEYSAALELQRKALKLVIGDTDKYNKAQEFLGKTSQKLAIPQDVITRQFTALTASVLGAGLSVDDAQKSFLAIASGIRGTGGTLEDMKSAMRATAQVFSKGKVSAEELRQQLGERLPGAFTLFADSMNMMPKDLDKALEQGKVTLDDFMKFSKTLFDTYGKNAEILAQSPAAAGNRLQTEMSLLRDNIGKILRPMGSDFQDFATKAVKELNKVITATKKLFGIGTENQINKLKNELSFFQSILDAQENVNRNLKKLPGGDIFGLEGTAGFEETKRIVEALKNKIKTLEETLKEANDQTKKLKKNQDDLGTTGVSVFESIKTGATSYLDSIKSVSKQIQDATVNAFKGMEDALVNFVTTGKLNFADFTRSILADITRIVVRQAIITPLLGAFGITTNATGNVYDKGLKKFAKGGIVTQPTLFAYGSGGSGNFGLMGEAGAEAILPLKRGRSGNLGVEASGGATNIVVNVDASGSSVEGDEAQGKALGLVLSSAIESELIKQKRPGGLLA